jgi:DNA gyrase subunit A
MVALVDGRPQVLNLKQILACFLKHRREVVTRRSVFELRKARERAHVLEGLAVALANIDEMIELIKTSPNRAEARDGLLSRTWNAGLVVSLLDRADASRSRPENLAPEFGIAGDTYRLSEVQATAILELQLQRLTGLEQDKIINEYKELLEQIDEYLHILSSEQRLIEIIRDELKKIRDEYGDKRRTEIIHTQLDLSDGDLITEEDMVVTMSHEGYVKSQPLTDYRAQRRGGRGKSATATKEEDYVDKLIVANTHDTILCFSSFGKAYWLKVYQLPVASRAARGKPFVNLIALDEGEKINAILPIKEFTDNKFIFMATSSGTVKKTPLNEFERQRANGKIAIDLRENDTLVGVAVTDGKQNVMLFASSGKANCFNEADVRSMGRTASGVRGMRLQDDQKVISLIIASEGTVLTITENGYGKRTWLEEFTLHKRGGQGMIAIQTSERNGALVGAVLVNEHDEIMLITDGGTLVRTPVDGISIVGRNTQGVRIIRLDKGEKVIGVDRIEGLAGEGSESDEDFQDDGQAETNQEDINNEDEKGAE